MNFGVHLCARLRGGIIPRLSLPSVILADSAACPLRSPGSFLPSGAGILRSPRADGTSDTTAPRCSSTRIAIAGLSSSAGSGGDAVFNITA